MTETFLAESINNGFLIAQSRKIKTIIRPGVKTRIKNIKLNIYYQNYDRKKEFNKNIVDQKEKLTNKKSLQIKYPFFFPDFFFS